MLTNLNSRRSCDVRCLIGAAGIDQMNIVAPPDRLQQPGQIRLLVLGEDDDRNTHNDSRVLRFWIIGVSKTNHATDAICRTPIRSSHVYR